MALNPAAIATMQKGLSVTSTATPALSGTYPVTGQELINGLQAQISAILLDNTFADGGAALAWPDIGGTTHSFDVAQFKTLASALLQFQAQWTAYAMGATTTAPPTTATIP